MTESSLYDRLGGAFAIAAVVDHFSDAIVQEPDRRPEIEEPRPPGMAHQQSRQTSRPQVHAHAVGLQRCGWTLSNMQPRNQAETPLGLEEAHRELKISPAEFDEVAAELGRTLDFFKVPEQEKEEVLAAFAAHKGRGDRGILAVARAEGSYRPLRSGLLVGGSPGFLRGRLRRLRREPSGKQGC